MALRKGSFGRQTMTGNEVIQFFLITLALAISYWWLWTWNERGQRNAVVKLVSAKYPVAQAGSLLAPSLDPYITAGATVYIPAADGLYPTRIKTARRSAYRNSIQRWLGRGASVHIIVTLPCERACEEWRSLVESYPNQFFVHLLHRDRIAGPQTDLIRSQIERLDTFHPLLVTSPDGATQIPGAMWIEGYHPIGSKYAYDVEFVNPEEAAKDGRFNKYKQMYEGLLQGAHVESLTPGQRKHEGSVPNREPSKALMA
jgi:hypothetical protein